MQADSQATKRGRSIREAKSGEKPQAQHTERGDIFESKKNGDENPARHVPNAKNQAHHVFPQPPPRPIPCQDTARGATQRMISAATETGRRKCRSVGSVRRISTGFYVTHNNRCPKKKTFLLPSKQRHKGTVTSRRAAETSNSLCSFLAFDILTGCCCGSY